MKTTVKERRIQIVKIEFHSEDLLKLLRFDRGDGVKEQLPWNTSFSWNKDEPVGLVAEFEVDTTPPNMSGLSQKEVDVFDLIRQAEDTGITYNRLQDILEDVMARQAIEKIVRSLVRRRIVEECEERETSNEGGPPRKLWRSTK